MEDRNEEKCQQCDFKETCENKHIQHATDICLFEKYIKECQKDQEQ